MSAVEQSTTSSQQEYYASNAVVEQYAGRDQLFGAEKAVLGRLSPILADAAVLDIGIGGGRTTVHLLPLAGRYVGIDFASGMVAECRRRFAHDASGADFEVCDARDLARFDDQSFDVVWFSYNGLDAVGSAEDRARALSEMVRVCAAGGHVIFSSHNLNGVRRFRSPPLGRAYPFAVIQAWRTWRRFQALNPQLEATQGRGEGLLCEVRPTGHVVEHFFIRPDLQLIRLNEIGLVELAAVGSNGEWITGGDALGDLDEPFTHYWSRKPPTVDTGRD